MTASPRAIELANVAAAAASDKLASDIVAIDVSEHLALSDVFVVCSAQNDRQLHAVVDGVEEGMLKVGVKPARREGRRDGQWVLLDFVEIIVHVMHTDARQYYAMERLWKDCPFLPLPDSIIGASKESEPPAAASGGAS